MLLYCIDKKHPLYGRTLRIDKTTNVTDGTRYIDVETGVPTDLKPSQVAFVPPEGLERKEESRS